MIGTIIQYTELTSDGSCALSVYYPLKPFGYIQQSECVEELKDDSVKLQLEKDGCAVNVFALFSVLFTVLPVFLKYDCGCVIALCYILHVCYHNF